jgi:hypothetical protein
MSYPPDIMIFAATRLGSRSTPFVHKSCCNCRATTRPLSSTLVLIVVATGLMTVAIVSR